MVPKWCFLQAWPINSCTHWRALIYLYTTNISRLRTNTCLGAKCILNATLYIKKVVRFMSVRRGVFLKSCGKNHIFKVRISQIFSYCKISKENVRVSKFCPGLAILCNLRQLFSAFIPRTPKYYDYKGPTS